MRRYADVEGEGRPLGNIASEAHLANKLAPDAVKLRNEVRRRRSKQKECGPREVQETCREPLEGPRCVFILSPESSDRGMRLCETRGFRCHRQRAVAKQNQKSSKTHGYFLVLKIN